ncbi:MAG: hypothetical protein ACJ76H_05845 [Bacteriovoracaceae bacterium]
MRALSLLIIFTLFISCGGGGGGGGGGSKITNQPQDENPTPEDNGNSGGTSGGRPARIVYDSDLSPTEKQALDASTSALGRIPINGNSIGGFSQAFGGSGSGSVVSYFEKRVHYAVSGNTALDERIVLHAGAAAFAATNIGSALWVESVVNGTGTEGFVINGKTIQITSSRVGIMQFGPAFTSVDTLQQVNTLVHEARHSDCTGGISAEELNSMRSTGQALPTMECGHFHVLCPPGHAFAGLPACDPIPWGAYAIGAIHSLAISRTCTSCSETDKAVAESEAADSFSRLLYSTQDLLSGKLGSPDMSSSTNVQDSVP